MAGNLFDILARGRPAEPAEQPPNDAQKMLDWLLRWPKPTVYSRDIYQYGPGSIRSDREKAIRTAEVLAKHGWLTPLETRQRNHRLWRIVRKEPTIHPRVAD